MNATLEYHDGYAVLMFPFNRNLVEALKIGIPAYARQWVPERKQWLVAPPWDRDAARMLKAHLPWAEIADRPGASGPTFNTSGCACDADHRKLHICQTAPRAVIDAAYRALARELHPDRGGDHEEMVALNNAFERVLEGVR